MTCCSIQIATISTKLGQVQSIQSNPNGTPPDSTTEESPALPTFYRTQPGLNAPAIIETGTGIEHQVNKSVSVSATYLYSRGIHQLLSRNIDAPLPDGTRPALGLCPSNPVGAAPGTPCNIYEYDSLAVFKENQIFLNLNVAYGRKLTFTGFYIYSKANSDTGGPGYHPSNQYDIMQDYGRQFFDVRNRVFAFANYSAPYGFRISPFLSASSGAPFNLQLSQDINGDSFFNDRPTFASSLPIRPTVDTTKYGNFDISRHAARPESKLIPINYGNGPVQFAMNMRVAKSFGVGPRVEEGKGAVAGGGGGHGGGARWAHARDGLRGNRRRSSRPKYARRSPLQHYVERVCAQYIQRGESCAAEWDTGRASGWDHRFAVFWQVESAGDWVLLPRFRGAGF